MAWWGKGKGEDMPDAKPISLPIISDPMYVK
jgi:hypothetical protein